MSFSQIELFTSIQTKNEEENDNLFFVNREQEVKELTEVYLRNYESQLKIGKNITEERHLLFVVATQTFGSGKTRFGFNYLEKVKTIKELNDRPGFKELSDSTLVSVSYRQKMPLSKTILDQLLLDFNIKDEFDQKTHTKDTYEKMKDIGITLKEKYGSTFIFIDELHSLLEPDFEEYSNISNLEEIIEGKMKVTKNYLKRACYLWSLLLQITKIPGIFMYSTIKSIIFNFLGRRDIIKNISIFEKDIPPSLFYEVKLNPFKNEHLNAETLEILKEDTKNMNEYNEIFSDIYLFNNEAKKRKENFLLPEEKKLKIEIPIQEKKLRLFIQIKGKEDKEMILLRETSFKSLISEISETLRIDQQKIFSISLKDAKITQDKHVEMLDKDDLLIVQINL